MHGEGCDGKYYRYVVELDGVWTRGCECWGRRVGNCHSFASMEVMEVSLSQSLPPLLKSSAGNKKQIHCNVLDIGVEKLM